MEDTRVRDQRLPGVIGARDCGNECGQSLVAYSLLLVLIAVIVLGGVWLMRLQVSAFYDTAATEIGALEAEPTPAAAPTPTATTETTSWEDWYEVPGGGWSVDEEKYCVYEHGEHRSFFGAENWKDYVVRVTANLHRGSGFGVFFRATQVDHLNGYVFEYAPGGRCFGNEGCFFYRRMVEGRAQSPFAQGPASADFQWHNTVREIEVRVEGFTFTASIDGEEVLEAMDGEYTHGQAGLRTWDASEVCFWDLSVAFLKEPDRDRDDVDDAS